MILTPTNRRVIRPYDKPSFEHTQRYGLIRDHPLGPAGGLVFFLPFNEGSGGQVFDLSGRNNTGTFVNQTFWEVAQTGSGVGADGADDFINFSWSKLGINGYPFSIVWAAKHHTLNSYSNVITFSDADVVANSFFAGISENNKSMAVSYSEVTGWDAAETTQTIAAGERVTGAAVFKSNSDRRAYINGGGEAINTAVDDINFGNIDQFNLFKLDRSVDIYYLGNEFEYLCIYNRVLSASEIAQLDREQFCMVQKKTAPVYFFVPTGGVTYQELNLIVSADASADETDAHVMVDTGKAVQADAAATEFDTQQMVETGKAVEAAASVSCIDLKVVFELNLEVTASGSVAATDAHTMIETGKVITAIASPAVIDKQAMMETELAVSADASVSCIDTMGLLAHIAAFMILRQCT